MIFSTFIFQLDEFRAIPFQSVLIQVCATLNTKDDGSFVNRDATRMLSAIEASIAICLPVRFHKIINSS